MNNPTNPDTANFSAGEKFAGAYTLKKPLPDAWLPAWIAHDDELDREVALYFLPEAIRTDSRAMSDLRAAVRRNRQIIHPRIVRVHDLIEEEKWAAITTDVVEGESLAALLRKKQKTFFEVREIEPWVAQICQTLEDAHKADLLHGDLAPANIFVAKNGEVRLANFAISRVVLDVLGRAKQSMRGAAGDIAYASPQQLDGEKLGSSDDVYALGATVFELLTGKPPFFEGDLFAQIRKQTPPTISARRGELKLNGEPVPEAWEKIVAQCLEKDRGARPKSMREIAAKLAVEKIPAKPLAEELTGPAPAETKATETKAKIPAVEKAAPLETAAPVEAKKETSVASAKVETSPSAQTKSNTPAKTVSSKYNVPARESGRLVEQQRAAQSEAEAEPDEAGGTKSAHGKHFPRGSFLEVPEEKKPKSRVPKIAIGLAFVLIVIGLVGFLIPRGGQNEKKAKNGTLALAGEQPATTSPEPEKSTPEDAKPGPAAAPAPPLVASENNSRADEKTASSAQKNPAPAADAPGDADAKLSQAEQNAAEKARIAAAAKKAAEAAGASSEEKKKLQAAAEAAAQDAQKAAEEKIALIATLKKTNDELAAIRKDREAARDKAQAEADEAAKIAAEKARMADDAKKAALAVIQQINENTAALQKAEAEAQDLQKAASEKQTLAANAAKAAMEAETIYKQTLAAAQQAADEAAAAQANIEQAKSVEMAKKEAEKAEQLRKAREEEARRLEAQANEAKKAAEEAMAALEKARKAVEEANRLREEARKKAEAAGNAPTAAPTPVPLEKTTSDIPENPPINQTKLVLKTEAPKAGPPAPNPKAPSVSVHVPEAKATVDVAKTNSLGMRFVPVGDVLFSVWLTRVKDFEAFAKATNLRPSAWRKPDFKQGPDHPVVNVSWIDAIAFCKWLSEEEQKKGYINPNELYRLPTDLEWSKAVGLPEETGKTPADRDMGVPDIYPWGTQWPPPKGAGNYTGEETNSDVAIKGYDDGFPYTSPVGAFAANKFGLYDMGGNVWQWVMDWHDSSQRTKTLRGASWYNGALKMSLLSSCRISSPPDKSADNFGFRVVLTKTETSTPTKR